MRATDTSSNRRANIWDWAVLALVRTWCYLRHFGPILRYHRKFQRWPDPGLPRTFQDKLMWRRFFDHNPAWSDLADKLIAPQVARARVPELKSPKLLWVGTDPAEIPPSVLAGNVVIKMNNGSGRNIFVQDGQYDRAAMIQKAQRWFRVPYGKSEAQWVYSSITSKIFVEEMLFQEGGRADQQYNFYVSGGKIAYAYLMIGDRNQKQRIALFDAQGTALNLDDPKYGPTLALDRPKDWDRMCQIALKLAHGLDFVRCDFSTSGGDYWFSEFTLYPRAGLTWVSDLSLMETVNSNWDLNQSWFLSSPQRGWKALYAAALKRVLPMLPPSPPEQSMPLGASPGHGS